jgi:hypothetical protein
MLRNPVDMFFSLYAQRCFEKVETAQTSEEAWRLQHIRKNNSSMLPAHCPIPQDLYYSDACKLGHAAERLLHTVPRKKIHVIFYEDFKNQTKKVYEEVLAFFKCTQ